MWDFRRVCIFKNLDIDQIQNGRLSAIIYFHMPNILQTVLDFHMADNW